DLQTEQTQHARSDHSAAPVYSAPVYAHSAQGLVIYRPNVSSRLQVGAPVAFAHLEVPHRPDTSGRFTAPEISGPDRPKSACWPPWLAYKSERNLAPRLVPKQNETRIEKPLQRGETPRRSPQFE